MPLSNRTIIAESLIKTYAALLFPPIVALSASLIAPLINHALTGNPPLPVAAQLSAELLVFSGVVLLLRRSWPRLPVIAPLTYVAARVVVFFAQQPATIPSSGAWQSLWTSLQDALPGLGVLLTLNWSPSVGRSGAAHDV